MGFSVVSDITPLGGLGIVLLISAGLLVLTFYLAAVNRARHDVADDDPDAPKL